MKKKKTIKNILMITAYFAIGIGALVFAYRQKAADEEFYEKAQTVDATVVDVVTTKDKKGTGRENKYKKTTEYDVYVSYTVDGVEYNHIEIATYDSKAFEGNVIELHYDPKNPEDARDMDCLDDQVPTAAIVGAIFIVIGLGLSVVTVIKIRKSKK